jgi:hypothetical protein
LSGNQPVQANHAQFSGIFGTGTTNSWRVLVQEIRVMSKQKTLGYQIDSPYDKPLYHNSTTEDNL